jgi:glycosyltransferase involved in cell wall biosynthesis
MNVLYIYSDTKEEWNCSEWRCVNPTTGINDFTDHSAKMLSINNWMSLKKEIMDIGDWADIIVVQRLIIGDAMAMIEIWKARGKVVVVDLDDAYHLMSPRVRSYKFWHEGHVRVTMNGQKSILKLSPVPFVSLTRGVKLAHGLTSPSRLILDYWKDVVPYRYYVPNYLPGAIYTPFRKMETNTPEILNIGWGGSFSHTDSFHQSQVLPALNRVLKARPNTRFIAIGGSLDFGYMTKTFPRKSVQFLPWVEYKEWPKILGTFDIGIAPLSGLKYDDHRSWIKAIEYGVMGIPWVGTNSPAWQDAPYPGTLVKNTINNWESALLEMIDNYAKYKREALEVADRVLEKVSIESQSGTIIDTYQQIIDEVRKDGR